MAKNHLKHEKSLYLQLHSEDPIDWYPWSRESLDKAKYEKKPIFLSIGYSACHWCHVMQKECFQNQEIADILNRNFVSIKVDREEYPEIDEIYMHFVVQTTGNGGWPLSVFLTSDLKPFFGGTYFPPYSIGTYPGFKDILIYVKKIWEEQRENIEVASSKFVQNLQAQLSLPLIPVTDCNYKPVLDKAYTSFVKTFDTENTGWGLEPKFPPSLPLTFLLHYSRLYRNDEAWNIVYKTLINLAFSGLHDHVGGGFHRYCVDRSWHIPHFEKMLYDNAQLAHLYAESFGYTHCNFMGYIARRTLDYIIRELHSPEGGFYSSQDADSEHIEGKFYVWTHEEVREILGSETRDFCHFWGIKKDGNWREQYLMQEGETLKRNVIDPKYAGVLDKGFEVSIQKYMEFQSSLNKLFSHRKNRVKPLKDNKCIASWNALTISALAKSASLFISESEQYQRLAEETARLYLKEFEALGFLPHVLYNPNIVGLLEDYTLFTLALLDLYELTLDKVWLEKAVILTEQWIKEFSAGDELGFYRVMSKFKKEYPMYTKPVFDQQEPSGNSSAGMALARIGSLVNSEYIDIARQLCNTYIGWIQKAPVAFPAWLNLLLYIENPPVECTLFYKGMNLFPHQILSSIYRTPYPFFVFRKHEGIVAEPQDAIAMFCYKNTCSAPIKKIEEIPQTLLQILK